MNNYIQLQKKHPVGFYPAGCFIWDRSKNIDKVLREELLTGFLTGRGYNKTAKEIEARMASGAMEARRLVRTESAYIEEAAELESYKECDIERLRFLATLDVRTSDICAAHDGDIIEVDKAVPGVNIPPLHPWCRSTTIAVFDDDIKSKLKRRAKDPETGEDMLVPADMTYSEWKNSLSDNKIHMTEDKRIEWLPRKRQISTKQYTELRDYAEKRGIKLAGFRKSDVDIELAKEFIDDTAKMIKKYPRLLDDDNFTLCLKDMNPQDFAETKRGVSNKLWLNKAMMRGKRKLAEEYEKLANKCWFVKGTDYHSVIYHEFGHLVEDKYGIDSMQIMKDIIKTDSDNVVLEYCEANLSKYSFEYSDGREIISEIFSAYEQNVAKDFVLTFINLCGII